MFEVNAQSRRGIVLRIVLDQGDFGVTDEAIIEALELPHNRELRAQVGQDIGHDVIRADFAWLERLGLVHTLVTSLNWTATITTRGKDVALGRERVPGLKRWVG